MVAPVALPLSKLGGLLLKTLAKPLAKRIKHDFSRYPSTSWVLTGIGQVTHKLTTRLTIWSAGFKVRSVKPLENDKALAKGADFLGESIVFLVGGSVVVYEYTNSKEKERKKEEKQQLEVSEQGEALQKQLDELKRRLADLERVTEDSSVRYRVKIEQDEKNFFRLDEIKMEDDAGAAAPLPAHSTHGRSGANYENAIDQVSGDDDASFSDLKEKNIGGGVYGWITGWGKKGDT